MLARALLTGYICVDVMGQVGRASSKDAIVYRSGGDWRCVHQRGVAAKIRRYKISSIKEHPRGTAAALTIHALKRRGSFPSSQPLSFPFSRTPLARKPRMYHSICVCSLCARPFFFIVHFSFFRTESSLQCMQAPCVRRLRTPSIPFGYIIPIRFQSMYSTYIVLFEEATAYQLIYMVTAINTKCQIFKPAHAYKNQYVPTYVTCIFKCFAH